jgi:Outer membrane protein beta-barrel domain
VTGLLRRRTLIAPLLALALLPISAARQSAFAEPSAILTISDNADQTDDPGPADTRTAIEPGADGAVPLPNEPPPSPHPFSQPPDNYDAGPPDGADEPAEPDSYFSKLKWLGLRHSSTDGRNAGMGIPLTGTSWLNRPYYFGGDIGTIWLTRPVNSDLTSDIDVFGGVFAGCDWDYYWGTELAVNRATPEIINETARDAKRGDALMEETVSLMYYPWGDSLFRPYWRCGIGATEIDYPTDRGHRRDETLWTFPVGVGLKYPFRRWLAARAEFTDQLALGNSGVATQHDLTLTFGLEWRFGAHPRSYWPWNPSRHIW